MSDTEQDLYRGAAEESTGVPVTETDVEVAQRPPSDPAGTNGTDPADGVPGHPDAAEGDR